MGKGASANWVHPERGFGAALVRFGTVDSTVPGIGRRSQFSGFNGRVNAVASADRGQWNGSAQRALTQYGAELLDSETRAIERRGRIADFGRSIG